MFLINEAFMKSKRAHVFNFFIILVVCCTFAMLTFSGCGTSTDWVQRTIEQHYFRFDGDYSSLENLDGLSISQMVAKLDRYSAYYTKEEYAAVTADNAGSKSGIGISYTFSAGVGAVVRSVIGNSPAKAEGLKAGDIIISATAGDESVKFEESSDIASFITARTAGEQFTLNLEGGSSVTLAKAEYTASYAFMFTNDCSYEIVYDGNSRLIKVDDEAGIPQLPDKTAYMYLSQFYGYAAEEVEALISVFNAQGCTSLILDLRDNGGGFVDLMAKIGGRFTSTVVEDKAIAMKAVYKSGREEVEYCYEYTQNVVPAGTDVYVMANHNTASASEALIGVLVSYNILDYENIFLSQYAGLVAKSYGKGIMQSTFTRLTGEALKLTVAGIYWANDKTIHDVGLTVADGCSVAPASNDIVSIGYDDELEPVIAKIYSDRASKN